jgi:hypothetical protein
MTDGSMIEWTAQHRYLWTGRCDDMPVGTIEHGAHFTFIDVLGAEHHGFSTLNAAQAAAENLVR